MKITCNKSDLLKGVNIALRAVPVRTTMEILNCILFDCTEGEIKLTTNDMELGIETTVAGEVIENGRIALDAKFFSEIVRKLPDSEITISTDENFTAYISCEETEMEIPGRSGDDFSYLPYIERESSITVSDFTLKEVIRQTLFSIDEASTNKVMTGELFEINGNNLKVVSLDRYRVSVRNVTLNDTYNPLKVIVPGKTLNELSKILNGDAESEVVIYFTTNHIMFLMENTLMVSRLIEGEYFKIDQMISRDYGTQININKKQILDCIDRATLYVKEGNKKPVIFDIADGKMNVSITSPIGKMNAKLDIEKTGADVKIGFDPKFLIDALRVIDDENISIYFMNAKAPCTIKDEEGKYLYLILPVNY